MPVLIDTDVAIELMRHSPYALDCVSRHDDSIYVSSVTVAELYFGAYNSARPNENVAKIRGFLENFPRVTITDEVAERFGRIKAELRRRSVQIAPFDLMIASIALENDFRLATGNTKHFAALMELQTEDWVRSTRRP